MKLYRQLFSLGNRVNQRSTHSAIKPAAKVTSHQVHRRGNHGTSFQFILTFSNNWVHMYLQRHLQSYSFTDNSLIHKNNNHKQHSTSWVHKFFAHINLHTNIQDDIQDKDIQTCFRVIYVICLNENILTITTIVIIR